MQFTQHLNCQHRGSSSAERLHVAAAACLPVLLPHDPLIKKSEHASADQADLSSTSSIALSRLLFLPRRAFYYFAVGLAQWTGIGHYYQQVVIARKFI